MSTLINVMTSQETCFILRAKLGNLAAWDHLLSDMRRNKREFMGHLLLPVGVKLDRKSSRPMYAQSDVIRFINAVRDEFPLTERPTGGGGIETIAVAYDPTGASTWKDVRFKRFVCSH